MSEHPSPQRANQEQINGFHIPSTEELLRDQRNGTNITLRRGESFSTGFNQQSANQPHSPYKQASPTQIRGSMNGNNYQQEQEQVPDQLLSHFASNKRPEDKPFSYIPSGGISELQQRQREVAPPPVKPKPRLISQQASYAGSESSQNSYDPASLFTPAYREMVKSQQEMLSKPLPAAVPADMVGFGPGKIPQEDVAAYILQPDGTMAALRWNDRPGPDLQNSAVMAALMEEQNAQVRGTTSGRIHNANGGSKQGLSFKVLQWLTGTDSEDGSETTSNYSGSHDGQYANASTNPLSGRRRQQSFEAHNVPEKIHEDNNGNELEYLYNGSKLPSRSFRRLLRSVSTTSTDEAKSLPSPSQESPDSHDGKPRRHGIKIISRSASRDQITPPKPQPPPQEDVAYCDF